MEIKGDSCAFYELMEIQKLFLLLNQEIGKYSKEDIVELSLILFELICDAHYDRGNERKKFILHNLIDNEELFFEALETLSMRRKEFNKTLKKEFQGEDLAELIKKNLGE